LSDQQIENEIKAKGLNAPRLSPADIDAVITGETFTVLPSGKVMVCELTLLNGYTVRGESATVSKENFDFEIGQKISRENARNQIWQLEGYLLQQRLYEPKLGDRVIAIKGAINEGVTGVLEIIRSHDSYGVRKDDGQLHHEHPAHLKKAA
jgi:hypothetical protein